MPFEAVEHEPFHLHPGLFASESCPRKNLVFKKILFLEATIQAWKAAFFWPECLIKSGGGLLA
jgi:hypothetical protein